MEQVIDWFIANGKMLLDAGAYLIAAASIIVKLTPTQKDNVWFGKIMKLLSKVSLQELKKVTK